MAIQTIKTILSTWGSDILVLPNTNIIFKHMVKYNLNHADIIISNSLFISNQIKKLTPQVSELHTIYYGVSDFPKTLDLEHKENIILSNRLHKPLYDIDKIIIAFAKLIKIQQYADYQLVIAATGTDTNNLILLTKKLNITQQVQFVGMLNSTELYSWYKRAKLFVSVPKSDATAFSICEAMSFGCYPILSNLPASLELVLDDINGTICQNKDQLELDMAYAIHKIENHSVYETIAGFNYNMMKQKAIYTENIKKIIAFYNA